MPIFGKTKLSEDLGILRTVSGENHISLFSSGSVVVRGPDEHTVEKLTEKLERATKRALLCQACGSCIPQCEYGALNLGEGKIGVEASDAWEKNPKKAPKGVDMPKTTLKDDKDTEYTVWTKEEFCAEYPEELVCRLVDPS